jgi:hypothetical protein
MACLIGGYEHIQYDVPRCFVDFLDYQIFFEFDTDMRILIRTIVPMQKYTLGELMLSWGTPTGVTRNRVMAYVYWWNWWALVDARSFRPDSRVLWILYDHKAQSPASPWHGFSIGKNPAED